MDLGVFISAVFNIGFVLASFCVGFSYSLTIVLQIFTVLFSVTYLFLQLIHTKKQNMLDSKLHEVLLLLPIAIASNVDS